MSAECWICWKPIALKDMPVHNKCENKKRRADNERGFYGGFQWEMLPE